MTVEVLSETKIGTVNAKNLLLAYREAVRLKDGTSLNLLNQIIDECHFYSQLVINAESQLAYSGFLLCASRRVAAAAVLEALKNSEDFSPLQVEERMKELRRICHFDDVTVAQYLSDMR
jgi:hypothetical protein